MSLTSHLVTLQRQRGLSDGAFVEWLGVSGLGRTHWVKLRTGANGRRPSLRLIQRLRGRLAELGERDLEAVCIAALLHGEDGRAA